MQLQYSEALIELRDSLFEAGWERGLEENYRIPVHLYITQSPSGSLPFGQSQEHQEAMFLSSLQSVNEALAPRIEFYVVGVDIIPTPTTRLFFGSRLEEINTHIQQNYPSVYNDNAVRVYLTETDVAKANFPEGIAIGGGNTQYRWLMHELGHFFGLLHTQTFSYSRTGPIWLLPDGGATSRYNQTITLHTLFERDYCESDSPVGLCFGDFISSTPPDLLDGYSTDLDFRKYNYDRELPLLVEGEEETYHFDFFNTMSYWNVSSTRLLQEQKDRMYDVLTIPFLGTGVFGGDMSFLIDDNVPLLNYSPSTLEYIRQTGEIDLVNFVGTSSTQFQPFHQGKVRTYYSGAIDTTHLVKDPYIGDGIFKLNRFVPVNQHDGQFVRFRFDSLAHQSEPLAIYNDDLHINIGDVIAIRRHILGLEEIIDPYQKIAADVNNTGSISTADIVMIVRKILGVGELVVPQFRFVPRYSLTDKFVFSAAFDGDPFTAVWEHDGNPYSYLGGSDHESYLGIPVPGSVRPNEWSFSLRTDDEDIHELETVSFNAVRSGDVNTEDALMGGICEEVNVDQLITSTPTGGNTMTYSMSFPESATIESVSLVLEIKATSDAVFTAINGHSFSTQKEELLGSNQPSVFDGLVSAGSKKLSVLSVTPEDSGKSNYFTFTISGLEKSKGLNDVIEINCPKSYLSFKEKEEKSLKSFSEQDKRDDDRSFVSISAENSFQDEKMRLSAWPNPVTKDLKIQLPLKLDAAEISVLIYNARGQVIKGQELTFAENQQFLTVTDLDGLNSGLYFCKVVIMGRIYTASFIK